MILFLRRAIGNERLIFDYSDPIVDTLEFALTQIPTHFRERPLVGWGANPSGLRVFPDFRG